MDFSTKLMIDWGKQTKVLRFSQSTEKKRKNVVQVINVCEHQEDEAVYTQRRRQRKEEEEEKNAPALHPA